ncbi:DUF3515 domain-containing protein [Actinocorallia sp. API 0066]|uniref:DUF3515 family protein n=1 Tax=Actinocorallia sp. API 0066 TaxID=2896846 RepID=UPI001E57F668|nr:DUF3515 family protein [Actinocorallia sp. API 0066]MCD0452118.1 DUF3515 domain-containing protein [Actinocorallia sp. API 0066]
MRIGSGVLVSVLGGCAGGGGVEVPIPSPTGQAATICGALEYPKSFDGLPRRKVSPPSNLVAAWGEPAIALRCGVARPSDVRGLIPDVVNIAGLLWAPGGPWPGEGDQPVTWTLVGRTAYVEVTIPRKYTSHGRPVGEILGGFSAILKDLPKLPEDTY